MSSLAQIAAEIFAQRRATASRLVAERKWSAAEAEERLRPWLHLAAMAGAEIDAVYEDAVTVFPFDRAGTAHRLPMSLFLSADDRHAARIALLDACDAAVTTAERDPARLPHARRLLQLAGHLGAARIRPAQTSKPEAA